MEWIETTEYNRNVLVHNEQGNYSFLRGIAPYSAGVIADAGHEIVHVSLHRPKPLADGFSLVREHLQAQNRPVHALCAMELRSPKPFTFEGFNEFNGGYVRVLRDWGILYPDGTNPIARSNVAPEIGAPSEPSLYAFSYTMPSDNAAKTFVVAGSGELPEGSLVPSEVVALGDTSPEGMRAKAELVMYVMTARTEGLGASWDDATHVNLYTVHSIGHILAETLIRPMRASAMHGLTWHYARPPIITVDYEMDLRGCRRELVL